MTQKYMILLLKIGGLGAAFMYIDLMGGAARVLGDDAAGTDADIPLPVVLTIGKL